MISFQEYLQKIKEGSFSASYEPHRIINDCIAVLSNMEPKEIEDFKSLLLELQKTLNMVLSGQE